MKSTMPNAEPDTQTPIRVFIVDDHPVVRLGLTQLLGQDPGIEVCGEAEQVKEAIEKLDKARPDVAIVDLALPDANGIDLIRHLKHYWIGVKIIVVSTYPETVYGSLAKQAGADVYINKHEAMDEILEAIHSLCDTPPDDEDDEPKSEESHWFG
jgi:DNA-binding NarL/FixJ family response regulator